jgi:Putative Flp pilus-assembly TadE/G-like
MVAMRSVVATRSVVAVRSVVATLRLRLNRVGERPLCPAPDQREQGQISLLILGFTVIALMLIIGAVDVTAVQLARTRMLDAADGAALDASDALDNGSAYGGDPFERHCRDPDRSEGRGGIWRLGGHHRGVAGTVGHQVAVA